MLHYGVSFSCMRMQSSCGCVRIRNIAFTSFGRVTPQGPSSGRQMAPVIGDGKADSAYPGVKSAPSGMEQPCRVHPGFILAPEKLVGMGEPSLLEQFVRCRNFGELLRVWKIDQTV